jgi:hypothetical protein
MKAQQQVPAVAPGGRNSKTVDGKTLAQNNENYIRTENVPHDVPRTIHWNLTTFSMILTFIMLRL